MARVISDAVQGADVTLFIEFMLRALRDTAAEVKASA